MLQVIPLMLVLLQAQVRVAPSPAAPNMSSWVVRVVSTEKIKPGTENEPHVDPGETILKVGVEFRYSGPEGEISAPVLKVTDGAKKEYVMLGNLQGTGGIACFTWLLSASNVRLGEKPKTLASKTVASCKDIAFYFYFVLPESPKEPLALVFADAPPVPLRAK
jgi:hypothetical protein